MAKVSVRSDKNSQKEPHCSNLLNINEHNPVSSIKKSQFREFTF